VVVVIAASVALGAIFQGAEWYAGNVAMPRYCSDPATTLARVERILTEDRPAGDQATRPYVIAAKLLYLVPRAQAESVSVYSARLRRQIEASCR
jgi:hypothetical protein